MLTDAAQPSASRLVQADARRGGSKPHALALVTCVASAVILSCAYLSPKSGLPHSAVEILIDTLPIIGVLASGVNVKGRRLPAVVPAVLALWVVAVAGSLSTNVIPEFNSAHELSPVVVAVSAAVAGATLTAREFAVVIRALEFAAIVESVLAIAEVQLKLPWAINLAATPDYGYLERQNLLLSQYDRASGTMGHPILLGMICSFAFVAVFVRAADHRKLIRFPILGLLAWALVLSGSRSCIAALAVGLIVYFLHPRTPIRRRYRWGLAMVSLPASYLWVMRTRDSAQQLSPFSLSNREAALPRLLATLDRLGMPWWFGENQNFILPTVADNEWLSVMGGYGVLGFLAILSASVFAIVSRSPLVASLSAFTVTMFLSFDVFGYSFSAVLFWLLFGAARGGASRSAVKEAAAAAEG